MNVNTLRGCETAGRRLWKTAQVLAAAFVLSLTTGAYAQETAVQGQPDVNAPGNPAAGARGNNNSNNTRGAFNRGGNAQAADGTVQSVDGAAGFGGAARGTRGGGGGGASISPAGGFGGAGGRGGGGGGGGRGFAPAMDGPTCSIDATVYDIRVPADKIGLIDAEALTRASVTPLEFEKALSALGTMQPLYRANQSVRLTSDYINIGTNTPYITSTQTTSSGQQVNSVGYASTGAIFTLAGKWSGGESIELNLNVQLSTLAEGSTSIAGNIKAPIFRTAQMSHKGMVEAKKSFVVVSVDAASTDENGKAVAYIARITLGQPANPQK